MLEVNLMNLRRIGSGAIFEKGIYSEPHSKCCAFLRVLNNYKKLIYERIGMCYDVL